MRFKNVVPCKCSPSDSLIANYVLCFQENDPKDCKGNTGKCCDNDNETCPLCSKNDFTRSSDCSCDALNLDRKILSLPVTKMLGTEFYAPAYCCDDLKGRRFTALVPSLRRKIIPIRKDDWRKGIKDIED